MINKKSSLKSGLVFSAAVAGSILGNYHRAYSLDCGAAITNDAAFGRLNTCDGAAGTAVITITGDADVDTVDFSIDNQTDGQDENAAIKIVNNLQLGVNNSLSVTLSSAQIQARNAGGVLLFARENGYYTYVDGNDADNDISLTINEDVSIDTTSDGIGGFKNSKEAISMINLSARGSTTLVLNGDVVTRGVGEDFDGAVNLYNARDGETNVTIGENSSIQAFGGGAGLHSGALGVANFTVRGDISSEANAIRIERAPTLNAVAPHINLTITSTSTIIGNSNAIYLLNSENGGNTNVTISGDVTSTNEAALYINSSSQAGNQSVATINSGANLIGKTAAIGVKDTATIINLAGGTNFNSTDDADIVRLTGTGANPVAINLPGATRNDVSAANNTVNISGNVVVTGDIVAGERVGDADVINFNAANLTLNNSDIIEFENIAVTENSVISLTNNSSIVGTVVSSTNKTLSLNLDASSLNGAGGNAVTFAGANDSMSISGTSAITGNVNAGDGTDTLNLSGAALTLNNGATFSGFEDLNITGTNQITGAFNVSAATVDLSAGSSLAVAGGIQGVNGNGNAVAMTINGATITSTGGTAINFADQNDSLTISGTSAITGNVSGGAGIDTLNLSATTLTLNSDVTFSGFENLSIAGTNIINGNIALQNLVGVTSEAGSVLEVNGTLTTTALQLGDQFTLNGNLTLNGDLIAGDGSVLSAGAAGSGIGTMTINGDIIFEPGSTLVVDVNGDNSDQIIVNNGNIDILEGVNLVINPVNGGSGSAKIFQVNNGIIDGNFSNILSTSGNNITLLYSANGPNLNSTSLNAITINTGILSSQIQSSVDNSILFSDTLNKQIARGAFNKGRNVWIRNIYRNRDIDSSSSVTGFTDRAYGIAFGGETDVNESVKVGFAAASIDSDVNVANNQGGSNGNSYFASAYANYKTNNNLFASLALTLGYHDNKNTRLVTNSGVQSYAKSETGNKDIGLNFQVGKKYSVKEVWNIMPKISLSYIRTMAGKISESGAGNSQISVKSYDFSTLKFREAVRVERSNYFKLSNIEFSPYFELGLAQERTIGDRKISGSFVAANQGFNTKLRSNNRNFVTGNVGFNMQINKDVSAFVSYENAVSSQETRNDLNAGVSVKF